MRIARRVILILSVLIAAYYGFLKYGQYKHADNTAPVITAETDDLYVSVESEEAELLADLTAEDEHDGDVTDTLMVMSRTGFVGDNAFKVTYAAFDQTGNMGKYTRTVHYTDYVKPHFMISAPLKFLADAGEADDLSYITASDCIDGDVTENIIVTYDDGELNHTGLVSYGMTLSITNSYGDVSELNVNVRYQERSTYNQECPALSQYVIYTQKGKKIDLQDYLTGIWSGGYTTSFDHTDYSTANVYYDLSPVDFKTPGTYTVVLTLYNGYIKLGDTEVYIVVEETYE